MDKSLEQMLGGILTEDTRLALTEAFDRKVEEARTEIEAQVREEITAQYAQDKDTLVQAMDRLLTDKIREELEEFAEDRRVVIRQRAELTKATTEARKLYQGKLSEHTKVLNGFIMEQLKSEMSEFTEDRKSVSAQRVKLSKAIVEAKREYKKKLAEHVKVLDQFMLRQLNEEINEFAQDRRLLAEQRVQMARQVKETRQEYKKQLAENVAKLEKFVLRQVTAEMEEFQTDKQALAESRVKLLREGRDKLDATRKDFIKKAAVMVEATIEEVLKKEMSQFREDLKVARENNFGRRVFEAFAAEYMTSSYYPEGAEVKKLQAMLSEQQQKLNEAKTEVEKSKKTLQESQSKLAQVSDKAKRTGEMSRLLGSLSRDKRAVMEEILATVPTARLEETYRKFLPSVLSEDETTVVRQGRKSLSESPRTERRTVALTGDRTTVLAESTKEQNVNDRDSEVGRILHLAGLQH